MSDYTTGPDSASRPPEPPPDDPLAGYRPQLTQPPKGRRLAKKADPPPATLTPEQRLLILDAWLRSGLPAGDFAPLVNVSKHTLYAWKKKFDTEGPAGLSDQGKQRGQVRFQRAGEEGDIAV